MKEEKIGIGLLLATIGGFLDAYSYTQRGGVFANAQTGNIVMLGISVMRGNYSEIINYLLPIICFFLGITMALLIKRQIGLREGLFQWRQYILLIELALLSIVAFLSTDYNRLANIMISSICALQVESFRKLREIRLPLLCAPVI